MLMDTKDGLERAGSSTHEGERQTSGAYDPPVLQAFVRWSKSLVGKGVWLVSRDTDGNRGSTPTDHLTPRDP